MPESPALHLWRGRILALLGILLVAFNLRSAVAAASPVFGQIRADFPLSSVMVGLLAMLPPVAFALFGIFTPALTRRFSLEMLTLAAMAAIIIGDLLRALSNSAPGLVIASVPVFAGMGVGNVLLPPLVRRYFPDRVGLLTALYAMLLSISTLLPPLVAVPVAEAGGWRFSLGMWSAAAMVAILPWLGLIMKRKPEPAHGEEIVEEPEPALLGRIWHSPLAWALGVTFSMSSLNAYVAFGWLPEILSDLAGTDAGTGGLLLSLYAAAGIPTAILVPMLAVRMKRSDPMIWASVLFFIAGDLGLIFAPAAATWLWVILIGFGPLLFPLCLVLINQRTRTHKGAVALSGFSQGVGYTLAAAGPFLVGVLHTLTGGWTVALLLLVASALVALVSGLIVSRPVFLEDQLHLRARR